VIPTDAHVLALYTALVGHSFGGATVLEYLKGSSPRFPYGVALDPWVEPITTSNSSSHRPLQRPVYVINSESFTIWSEHFSKVKALVKDVQAPSGKTDGEAGRGWIITLAGAEHLSFSDYPSLLPRVFRSTVTPAKCIEIYSRATLTQMELLGKRLKSHASDSQSEKQRAGSEKLEFEHGAEEPVRSSSAEPLVGVVREVTPDEDKPKERPASEHEEPPECATDDAEGTSSRPPPEQAEPGSPFSNENLHGTSDPLDFPQADAKHYRAQLEAIEKAPPASEEGGHTRREHLRHAKDAAAARLMERRQEHKYHREEREQKKDDEKMRKKGHGHEVRGVVAKRTPSGGMTSLPRSSDMQRDYTLDPEHLLPSHQRQPGQPEGPGPSEDVALVVESVRPLADDQKHKSYRKLRSISALVYRSYGMRPGIERPGSILIHEN
jgi:platelet-activating factor acetylhydrolase